MGCKQGMTQTDVCFQNIPEAIKRRRKVGVRVAAGSSQDLQSPCGSLPRAPRQRGMPGTVKSKVQVESAGCVDSPAVGDSRGKGQEWIQGSGLCHWVILVPFSETGTLAEKGSERKIQCWTSCAL